MRADLAEQTTLADAVAPFDPGHLLSSHAPAIGALIRRVARQARLASAEHDDFESLAWSHLVKNDYSVLRQYRGDATLMTYLATVLRRVLLDYRTAKWGKWRPSAQARRLGNAAVALERMVGRDDQPVDEALARAGVIDQAERATLRDFARQIPRRIRRREVPDEVLRAHKSATADPDAPILARDRQRLGTRVHTMLRATLRVLSEEDRDLLRCRYEAGMTVAAIAARSGAVQKNMYRRFEHLHGKLRSALEQAGINASAIHDVVGHNEDFMHSSL